MSRIAATFEKLKSSGKKALIPFVTAGDPDPQMTTPIMRALVEAGADIIVVGNAIEKDPSLIKNIADAVHSVS